MGETSDLLLMIFIWVVGWLCFFGKIHYNAYCRFAHFVVCTLPCKKGVKQNKSVVFYLEWRHTFGIPSYTTDSIFYSLSQKILLPNTQRVNNVINSYFSYDMVAGTEESIGMPGSVKDQQQTMRYLARCEWCSSGNLLILVSI